MKSKETFKINGMACTGCVERITDILRSLNGVLYANVSLQYKTAQVEYDPEKIFPEEIVSAIQDAGYDVARFV